MQRTLLPDMIVSPLSALPDLPTTQVPPSAIPEHGKTYTIDDLIVLYTHSSVDTGVDSKKLPVLLEELGKLKSMQYIDDIHQSATYHILYMLNGGVSLSPTVHHMLITGPRGSGKSCFYNIMIRMLYICNQIKNNSKVKVHILDLIDDTIPLLGTKMGAIISDIQGGVLIIDGIEYKTVTSIAHENRQTLNNILRTLYIHACQSMFHLILVGSSQGIQEMFSYSETPYLLLFSHRYDFPMYTTTQLIRLTMSALSRQYTLDPSVTIGFLRSQMKHLVPYMSYNGHLIDTILYHVGIIYTSLTFGQAVKTNTMVTKACITYAIRTVIRVLSVGDKEHHNMYV